MGGWVGLLYSWKPSPDIFSVFSGTAALNAKPSVVEVGAMLESSSPLCVEVVGMVVVVMGGSIMMRLSKEWL